MATKLKGPVKIAVIWRFDEVQKTKTAVKVAVIEMGQEEALMKKYPEKTYGMATFWDYPEDFTIKEGDTFSFGYDPYETD